MRKYKPAVFKQKLFSILIRLIFVNQVARLDWSEFNFYFISEDTRIVFQDQTTEAKLSVKRFVHVTVQQCVHHERFQPGFHLKQVHQISDQISVLTQRQAYSLTSLARPALDGSTGAVLENHTEGSEIHVGLHNFIVKQKKFN